MCTIDDMFTQLNTNRQLIATQMEIMGEILEKSNNILLQLETNHSKEPVKAVELPNMKSYSIDKETMQTLSKAIELYKQLAQRKEHQNQDSEHDLGFSDYIEEHCQRTHFLSSNVRKLLVIGDVMGKMIEKTQQQDISCDDEF